MLSSVLRSERAVEVNIAIMRIPLPSRLELVAAIQSPERLNPIHIHAYQLVCRQQ